METTEKAKTNDYFEWSPKESTFLMPAEEKLSKEVFNAASILIAIIAEELCSDVEKILQWNDGKFPQARKWARIIFIKNFLDTFPYIERRIISRFIRRNPVLISHDLGSYKEVLLESNASHTFRGLENKVLKIFQKQFTRKEMEYDFTPVDMYEVTDVSTIIEGVYDCEKKIFIESLFLAIEYVYMIDKERMTKKGKIQEVVFARQVFIYRMYQQYIKGKDSKSREFTVAKIGSFVGRDHATVLNSVKVVGNLLETSKELRKQYLTLVEKHEEVLGNAEAVTSMLNVGEIVKRLSDASKNGLALKSKNIEKIIWKIVYDVLSKAKIQNLYFEDLLKKNDLSEFEI